MTNKTFKDQYREMYELTKRTMLPPMIITSERHEMEKQTADCFIFFERERLRRGYSKKQLLNND